MKISTALVCAIALLPTIPAWAADPVWGCRTANYCNWADLHGKSFAGQDLTEMSFEAANLTGANLKGVKADHVVFQVANVDGADFSGAELQGATFFTGSAQKANFAGANLKGVNFTRTNLTGADFKGATLDASTMFIHANLSGATWSDGRICAVGSDGSCQ
jgi:uncharacterized protein YjbI with pentapeptide repeats